MARLTLSITRSFTNYDKSRRKYDLVAELVMRMTRRKDLGKNVLGEHDLLHFGTSCYCNSMHMQSHWLFLIVSKVIRARSVRSFPSKRASGAQR